MTTQDTSESERFRVDDFPYKARVDFSKWTVSKELEFAEPSPMWTVFWGTAVLLETLDFFRLTNSRTPYISEK